jgi:hypothetical protein
MTLTNKVQRLMDLQRNDSHIKFHGNLSIGSKAVWGGGIHGLEGTS